MYSINFMTRINNMRIIDNNLKFLLFPYYFAYTSNISNSTIFNRWWIWNHQDIYVYSIVFVTIKMCLLIKAISIKRVFQKRFMKKNLNQLPFRFVLILYKLQCQWKNSLVFYKNEKRFKILSTVILYFFTIY